MEQIIVALLFIFIGSTYALFPRKWFDFRAVIYRKVFKGKIEGSKRVYNTYRTLGIIFLVLGFFNLLIPIIANTQIDKINDVRSSPTISPPFDGEVTGEYVCLPHRDTSGPQTMECAYGLKLPNGDYYALDFGDNVGMYDMSEQGPVTLKGHFTPVEALSSDHWRKYDIEGIFSVEGNK